MTIAWGDCVIRLDNAGHPDEYVTVVRADEWVLASPQLVDQWRGPDRSPHVRLAGDVVTFGTEGKGMGVVSYLIGERTGPEPLSGQIEGHIDVPNVPLRRLR